MTELEKLTEDIKKQYGTYLTQRDFMNVACISSRTAYLATKKGILPFRKEYVGSVRYYRIKAEDVARYMENRSHKYISEPSAKTVSLLNTILKSEPDVLCIKLASRITGVHKNSIAKWIQKGYLKSFRWKGNHQIAKAELIRYMATPQYESSRNRSIQRQALCLAMEWLDLQRNKFIIDRKEEHDDNKGSY